jgi:hypothetical protein
LTKKILPALDFIASEKGTMFFALKMKELPHRPSADTGKIKGKSNHAFH